MSDRFLVQVLRVLGGLAAVLVISGCAGVGGDYRSGMDAQGIINSIEQDDVSALRAAVSSGKLGVNQRLSAPGYSAGAPLIALAARAG